MIIDRSGDHPAIMPECDEELLKLQSLPKECLLCIARERPTEDCEDCQLSKQ